MKIFEINSKKYGVFTVQIDDDRASEVLAAGPWHLNVQNGRIKAVMRNVRKQDGSRTMQKLHTFLTGWPLVDHRDGNPLNNTSENLRPATKVENGRNRGANRNNKSGYKGVCWYKTAGKYMAQIQIDGRLKFLGYFDDPAAASAVYEAKTKEIFGEFYRTSN